MTLINNKRLTTNLIHRLGITQPNLIIIPRAPLAIRKRIQISLGHIMMLLFVNGKGIEVRSLFILATSHMDGMMVLFVLLSLEVPTCLL